MSNIEKKHGLVLRKTTLRVLNDNELLWVAGAGPEQGRDTLWDYQEEGLSNVYTTRTTISGKTGRGNTIPTRQEQPRPTTGPVPVTSPEPVEW